MITISYRREDTAPITGRIYDRLEAIFGRDQVNVMETHQQAGVLTHLGPQISERDSFLTKKFQVDETFSAFLC